VSLAIGPLVARVALSAPRSTPNELRRLIDDATRTTRWLTSAAVIPETQEHLSP